ncbi:MAG: mechanosensitive ion channel [Gammaproteobacteria bacterium]|nr:mechanosensitive ion channel [Gammaproteobacteria bacterium]
MTRTDNQFLLRLAAMLLFACLAMLLLAPANAQSPIASITQPTIETLENRIRETEAATDLDDITRSTLLELYRKASSFVSQQQRYEKALEEFTVARESAPEQARELRKALEKLEIETVSPAPTEVLSGKPLSELEQQLLGEKANLTALSDKLTTLEEVLDSQSQRAIQARERLTVAKSRSMTIADELLIAVPEGELPRFTEARRWALEQEALSLDTEIQMLDQELLSQPMRVELLNAQRDSATLEIRQLSETVENLEILVVERRGAEARTAIQETDETQRQAYGKHSLVQVLAEKNALLSETLSELANSLEQVNNEENSTSEQARRINDNFRLARQKLEIAGLSQALGQVLVEESRTLPDSAVFQRAEHRHQERVIESSLRQIRNQQERSLLRDISEYVEDLIAWEPFYEHNKLRGEMLELAETRRELLDKAIAADDVYQQALGELDFARRQLFESASAYDQFLDERLLWIRTGELPDWNTFTSILQPLAIFLSIKHWQSLAEALVSLNSNSWILFFGLILFAVLMNRSPQIRTALRESGSKIGHLRHDRFTNTIKALGLTLLLALRWPVLLIASSMYLLNLESGSVIGDFTPVFSGKGQFVTVLGYALYRAGLFALFFELFYAFCKPYGLTVVHFRWNPESTELLAREIRRLELIFLPIAFIVTTTVAYEPATLGGGLSRLGFLIVMIALGLFLSRILAPKSGALREFYTTHSSSPLTWFRYFWIVLGIALPVALAGLALVGYTYTAMQFGTRLLNMLWLIVGIIFIHQLIERWVLLTEQKLAFRAALEKHRQQRAAKQAAGDEDSLGENDSVQFEEPEIDFGALSDDTTKLINTVLTLIAAVGLWGIWADVLPAFRILDDITLWHYSVVVEGAGNLVPVTLNNLILGILVIIIGIAAARRLPALLEIVLLARLNISAGSRYAIATLTQYGIVAIGVVLVFNLLGGSWSGIQWLIAALGVGIGFGLQEIVANFICGIILLFERPIRIGDVVTVGDTDGVVTKIRIRSTTIRNWDQKELLVPNKEFITGRLLNWTLSDPITRIVIPVGIAYGSDVTQAIKLVQEAAAEHERILDEPPTMVSFEAFGDNSLTIMLRCFVGSMDYWRQTTSELHQSINDKFEAAGIVIAFPQRDIHLNTSQPLDVRIHRVEGDGMAALKPG